LAFLKLHAAAGHGCMTTLKSRRTCFLHVGAKGLARSGEFQNSVSTYRYARGNSTLVNENGGWSST